MLYLKKTNFERRVIMDKHIWKKIRRHESETFYTINDHLKNRPFTYRVVDDRMVIITNANGKEYNVYESQFDKALEFGCLSGALYNNSVFSPSYIRGILCDRRIGESDC